jgi:hypothetical protein
MAETFTKSKLASLRPSNTNETQLYAVPAASEIDAVIRICNQDTTARTYKIAHTTAGHGDVAADGDDWIYYDKSISANETHELSIEAAATETIRVQASIADKVSFVLEGVKKVTS